MLYKLQCFNEWCSGPETYDIVDVCVGSQTCPCCGWIAYQGDGITKIIEEEGEMI
jgi:hypothetical protein